MLISVGAPICRSLTLLDCPLLLDADRLEAANLSFRLLNSANIAPDVSCGEVDALRTRRSNPGDRDWLVDGYTADRGAPNECIGKV